MYDSEIGKQYNCGACVTFDGAVYAPLQCKSSTGNAKRKLGSSKFNC